MAELAGGGAPGELILGVDDPDRALRMLEGSELVVSVRLSDEGLRAVLSAGAGDPGEAAARLNAALVAGGIGVMRLEPVRHSLERRFLEITTRLETAGEEVPA